jgi:hypothetical protein
VPFFVPHFYTLLPYYYRIISEKIQTFSKIITRGFEWMSRQGCHQTRAAKAMVEIIDF